MVVTSGQKDNSIGKFKFELTTTYNLGFVVKVF